MNFQCTFCPKRLNSAQGLKSHVTRLHKGASNIVVGDTSVFGNSHNKHSCRTVPIPAGEDPVCIASSISETGQCLDTSLVELLANLKSELVILKRIPKGARCAAANALTIVIENCLQSNTVASWERFLIFAAKCFRVPSKSKERQVSLSTLVIRNINNFMEENSQKCRSASVDELVSREPRFTEAVVNRDKSESIRRDTLKAEDRLSKYVVAKLSDGDVKGAVRVLCSEEVFAPRDSETLQALRSKHPSHDSPLVPPTSSAGVPTGALSVEEDDVKSAISTFPAGSAGGLDMFRPQHLKDLTSYSAGLAGTRLVQALTRLANIMLAGDVPGEICPVLYGATLSALKKKEGGIRPIAVGSVFRRMVAKMASFRISTILGNEFRPLQLGVGVKGGIEAASHAARRFVDFQHTSPKVLLKIDFFNAFNMVRRDVILQTVLEHFPDLYCFVRQCYGAPSHLLFGEEIIPSVRGIQQGDPLGPALFCMVVQPLARSMESELNIWYLDDVTLGGSPNEVLKDFEKLKLSSAPLGLEINFQKCEVIDLSHHRTLSSNTGASFQDSFPNIKFLSQKECSLLGCPLTDEALAEKLTKAVNSLELMSHRLKCIPTQCSYFLLKNCMSIPKLTHLLRCAPTWKNVTGLSLFDKTLKGTLESILNIELAEKAWEQSSWPVSSGGLGIRHVQELSLDAFLSSCFGSSSLVADILPREIAVLEDVVFREAMLKWSSNVNCEFPTDEKKAFQRAWEEPRVTNSILKSKELAVTFQEKARLHGVSSKESGAFLNALPSAPLGTMLTDDAFRVAVALRVGANICQPHTCRCGSLVDALGTHGLRCRMSKGRHSRHATVNDIIKRSLGSAGVPSILEPSYLVRNDNKRPDGITQIPWKNGKSLIWDFTCTDSLAPSYVEAASMEPLSAAKGAERHKRDKYSLLSQQHLFIPVAVECLGGIGRDGLTLLREIGKRITMASGEKRAGEFLLQRLSVAVQRGNAISITGSLPQESSMDDQISML